MQNSSHAQWVAERVAQCVAAYMLPKIFLLKQGAVNPSEAVLRECWYSTQNVEIVLECGLPMANLRGGWKGVAPRRRCQSRRRKDRQGVAGNTVAG